MNLEQWIESEEENIKAEEREIQRQRDVRATAEEVPLAVAAQIFRTGDIAGNINRMGFSIVRDRDDITGEELAGEFTIVRGDEAYRVNPDDLQNELLGAVRPTLQGIGAIGGYMAGGGIMSPVTSVSAATAGGTGAGQAYDLLLEQLEPSGQSWEQALGQAQQDVTGELTAALGGEIAAPVAKPLANLAIRGGQNLRGIMSKQPPEVPLSEGVSPEMVNMRAELQKAEVMDAGTREAQLTMPETSLEQAVPQAQSIIDEGADFAPKLQPDINVLAAEQELGIEAPVTAYTRDIPTLDVMQAAKEQPTSKLKQEEERALDSIEKELNDLRVRESGTTDKAQVNQKVADQYNKTISRAQEIAKKRFDRIADEVSLETEGYPQFIDEALNKQLRERAKNNPDNLEGLWADIYKRLERNAGESGHPVLSYGLLDEIRKIVGDGYQKTGPFKDASSRELDKVYAALSQDQQAMLAEFHPELVTEYQKANRISQKYLDAQTDAVEFGALVDPKTGKVNTGPFTTKLGTAISQLAKGDVTNFRKLMAKVPPQQRSALVMASMDDLFETRRYKTGRPTAVMMDAWQALSRNESAKKELYSYLSPRTQKRLDAAFVLADAIQYAKQRENKSGTAKAVIKYLDDQMGVFKRGWLTAKQIGKQSWSPAARGTAAGADAMESMAETITGQDILKDNSKTAMQMDEMLTSDEFKKAIRAWMDGSFVDADRL
jgi:hypothetical protein